MTVLNRILHLGEGRSLREAQRLAAKVNQFEPAISALSDADLRAKTDEFTTRLAAGTPLNSLLPEAFAVVRETAKRTTGMRAYDVQIVGAIALHQGRIAEMKTGEGKTLVATFPAYLNALTGNNVHVVTVNDYLAARDAELTRPVFEFLGLTVAFLNPSFDRDARRNAYQANVTYGTNSQFGFDYLRDNLVPNPTMRMQRGHHFVIVDEIDSILIDEASTPLVISGEAQMPRDTYLSATALAADLTRDIHFFVDERKRTVALLAPGIALAEKAFGIDNLYAPDNGHIITYIYNAIKAKALFLRDRDYLVDNGQALIIDRNTGRVLPGRRFEGGLHQALEAKEGLTIEPEDRLLASVTLQNYFRLYTTLSGMTGTASTDAAEFKSIYDLKVVPVPTNRPVTRIDHDDLVFLNSRGKFNAVLADISARHQTGQPILVGTTSVEKSEYLSRLLTREGIPHEVLNAKQHAREALIIGDAGRLGRVTIATNMAGRGTDILLGGDPKHRAAEILTAQGITESDPDYAEAYAQALADAKDDCADEAYRVLQTGGLYVLGTERNEARRIDEQLRGRSGRQGDRGETRFYLSLDDDIMRVFSTSPLGKILSEMAVDENTPIDSKRVTKSLASAQAGAEGRNFDFRRTLVTYDEVLNKQRLAMYAGRAKVLDLDAEQVWLTWDRFAETAIRARVAEHSPNGRHAWNLDALIADLTDRYPTTLTASNLVAQAGGDRKITADFLTAQIHADARAQLDAQTAHLDTDVRTELVRGALMLALDERWREHLNEMAYMKAGINLRAIGSRDPKVEYAREGFDFYQDMIAGMKEDALYYVFNVNYEQFLAFHDQNLKASGPKEPGTNE
jgi:preprotein translocase subunit SecA